MIYLTACPAEGHEGQSQRKVQRPKEYASDIPYGRTNIKTNVKVFAVYNASGGLRPSVYIYLRFIYSVLFSVDLGCI